MNLKPLFTRKTVKNLSRCFRTLSGYSCYNRNAAPAAFSVVGLVNSPAICPTESHFCTSRKVQSWMLYRFVHTALEATYDESRGDLETETEEDAAMNEFLSRFVWIMRGKLVEVYTDCDKKTIDAMLLTIVEKVVLEMEKGGLQEMSGAATSSDDFSEDLWRTVWEVSNVVVEDMANAKRKEKLKCFLHADKVKVMCRFAGEIGIRGDMLRELRFKWAREEMEESELYEDLERMRLEEAKENIAENSGPIGEEMVKDQGLDEKPQSVFALPKRHGKLKYKIYGLDLSQPKWEEVANKIHEAGKNIWPQEPKPISGKSKLIMEKILTLKVEEDPSPLLTEWSSVLQPSRVDWMNLLNLLEEKNEHLCLKIAEQVLDEESFQANIRDYSKLIDAYAQENHLADAERILKRMSENGILLDILTTNILVHMYSKAGSLDKARQFFDSLKAQGIQPDKKLYSSMIMAYISSGKPDLGESLMKDMEIRDIKPSPEIYMALLQSYSQRGNFKASQRIINAMQLAGSQPTRESCTLLIEAYGQAGDSENARSSFDNMIKLGHKPDDRSMASMIAAYKKDNLLDSALNLLIHHEKDGFEPGIATYTALVDWLGEMKLIDEAEQILDKISELSEAPPLSLQVSLCVMYASAGFEKKALQALGVLEAKKDQLGNNDYDRIIKALISGGFRQEARRIYELMEAQGFTAPDGVSIRLKASEANDIVRRKRKF
ncbi:hypothetical protein LIER_02315 [Lithospermum erythrorhizon]|uniref:PROP1-like PPR domain-containing protein n=1 Tax=Lithospermum erythrorhizon TaxID=34254 RepID=A0AAV3NPQ1_LITER